MFYAANLHDYGVLEAKKCTFLKSFKVHVFENDTVSYTYTCASIFSISSQSDIVNYYFSCFHKFVCLVIILTTLSTLQETWENLVHSFLTLLLCKRTLKHNKISQ